jgi:hypothetical protein
MLAIAGAVRGLQHVGTAASVLHSVNAWASFLWSADGSGSTESAALARALDMLRRRLDALVGPLNFCLLWSHGQVSCVAGIEHFTMADQTSLADYLDISTVSDPD